MKNIILFLMTDPNMKEILRNVSKQMDNDNLLLYKSKETQNWYKWERNSDVRNEPGSPLATGRPERISKEEREELLSNARIINWGNHILHDSDNIILNQPSCCKRSSNKWETRRVWQENGIQTPVSSDYLEDMVNFPFIARPQKHSRQSEFHVINTLADLSAIEAKMRQSEQEWYFQKIVQKDCEFRVYVGGTPAGSLSSERTDKVMTIFWKNNGDQLLSSNNVWNWFDDVNWDSTKHPHCITALRAEQGLNFIKQTMGTIKEECIKATKVLGLNYSGIDVGFNINTRNFNLFESNTNPELTALPQKKFAKYFDEVLRGNV